MSDGDDTSVEPDEVDPEAAAVVRALVTAFGYASDRETLSELDDDRREIVLPQLDDDRREIVLPDTPSEAIARLAATPLLSAPVKLELLAQLVRARKPAGELEPLARSLVRPDAQAELQERTVNDLLARLGDSKPGEDPIGRTSQQTLVSHDADLSDLIDQLVEDLLDLVLAFDLPDCSAKVVEVGRTSIPALSIATTAWTDRPLRDLKKVVDPFEWPKCRLQHVFFRSMTGLGQGVGLDAPDQGGWSRTLREVVDFSFGLGWQTFTTDLDFVYFESPTRVGCTYDRNSSLGNQITVDQGYLLAEDLGARRRVRTLKQVHFAAGDIPSVFVCPFWGPATSAIAWACLPSEEQP